MKIDPSVIAGQITAKAEQILKRGGVSARDVSNCDDAARIVELVKQLQKAILEQALEASIKERT